MSNPFPTTVRPWLRITQAKRDLSTLILAPGDIAVTETGKQYLGDGVTQLKNLLPSATQAQITAALAALTKATIGLGNVDNTSDANKPVSTAQQAAITAAINGLINSAPGALDTLNELAAALGNDSNYAATITAALNARLTATQVAASYVAFVDQNGTPISAEKVRIIVDTTTTPHSISDIVVVTA